MPKFRKKTVVIEARQFKTNNEADDANLNSIVKWINQGKKSDVCHAWHNGTDIFIQNSEGTHSAAVGDWIAKGEKGEFHSFMPDIFFNIYEPEAALEAE